MKTRMVTAFLLLLLFSHVALANPYERLPFIEDDFQKALAQAKQRSVPLFVDVWAPW
jgi:hypothetical protein